MSKFTLASDKKYGAVTNHIVLNEEDRRPIILAIIKHKERTYLAMHKGYWSKDRATLNWDRGIRLEIDEGTAEETLLAAQGMLMEYLEAQGDVEKA